MSDANTVKEKSGGGIASFFKAAVLPSEISNFERAYLNRLNKIAVVVFALHLPLFMLVAYLNDTGVVSALWMTSVMLLGPILAQRTLDNPRTVTLVFGMTSMLMGGLLVHFGQGPVQIEMHFYFFAMLAMLAVFGNPMTIIVAAVTVALHHLLVWAFLPASVFNYEAPLWVVLVHAAFVVGESFATCSIARSFFDNVIGLEKIVQERTSALDERNRDMRLVMDHVDQGLFTIDLNGVVSQERSATIDNWFGEFSEGDTWTARLSSLAADIGANFEMGWDQLLEDFLPLELSIDQLPSRFNSKGKHFEIHYTPILTGEKLAKMLIVITDITAEIERERLEAEQKEVLSIVEKISTDKAGFLEFYAEASELALGILGQHYEDLAVAKRALHTLKGNCMIYGIKTVAELVHELEDRVLETATLPSIAELSPLKQRWTRLNQSLNSLIGDPNERTIELDDEEYETILKAVMNNSPRQLIATMITNWKLERASVRLTRVAEQAQGIARRLAKPELHVAINDNDLRLDPARWANFWSAFVHVVRNAVDHGIESSSERAVAGKSELGRLELSTIQDGGQFIVRLSDDGRGINWDALAQKAERNGLPWATRENLIDALFADGVSTKDEVSEYSGRGVGMGAVREACISLGGKIDINSEPGKGTAISFIFPDHLMAESLSKRFTAA